MKRHHASAVGPCAPSVDRISWELPGAVVKLDGDDTSSVEVFLSCTIPFN
jgi:hypothetical protein